MRYILYIYDAVSPGGRGLRFSDLNGAVSEAAAKIGVSTQVLRDASTRGLDIQRDLHGVSLISILHLERFCESAGIANHSGARAMLIQREDVARSADAEAVYEGNPRTPVRDAA